MRHTPDRIFISATGQNDGKTVVSLGLIYAFKERFERVGFIKPVGQRYIIEQGEQIDEDSVLIDKLCATGAKIKDTSPITIDRGFTQKYILRGNKKRLVEQIKKSFKCVARGKDLVVIEGTGHAGVGSVFDLSNAAVAKMLDSRAVIISSGGIGRPIDQIVLNAALFEKMGVKIAGVIINKVRPEKYKKVSRIVRLGLKRKGFKVLGVIPYKDVLSEPTVAQIIEELKFKLLNEGNSLTTNIGKILVGAMSPHDALKYFSSKSLIITPGDREDIISAIVGYQADKAKEGVRIAGIILSGGIKPHNSLIDLVRRAKIPLMLAQEDTYRIASQIHDLKVKIRPEDAIKTRVIKNLIEEYVDIKALARQF